MMKKDKNRYVRIAAIQALSNIVETCQKDQASILFLSSVKSVLYSMIQDRSKDVRICTWKALARICTWKDISLLNSMLTSDISDVKVASAEALIRLGYHEGIAKLREMLKNKGKNGQMALDALARLGDREIIPDLVKMIKDEDPIVKKGAARALGSLGSEEEVPVLLGIIVSESDINPDAKDALIFIDRKLYCPFNWNNKEKYNLRYET